METNKIFNEDCLLEIKKIPDNSIDLVIINSPYDICTKGGKTGNSRVAKEVKNLHYKTIIFSNIGYPIFRDTVIYKKLSCYSSGELKRKITPLEDLSYTYFTVENIETKYDGLYRNRNNKEINKEELSFYDKFKTEEINKLNNIVNIVNDLLKDKIKIFEFKENNNRTFASFELKEQLNTKESIFLKGKINKEVYHLEIDNGNNTKSTIEIHLKNPLEKDLTLQKENKNV